MLKWSTAILLAITLFSSCKEKEQDIAHVSHILVMYRGASMAPASLTRTKQEAYAIANELLYQVKNGGHFAEIAKQYSDCVSSSQGGKLDPFKRGVMAIPFENAAFKLKSGEISDIVKTEFGFHIIKADP